MLHRALSGISIGELKLTNSIIYSPLAGCSDFPFRKMCRKYSASLIYCEMVKMEPLIRGDKYTLNLLDYSPDMHPIGAQICGSKPQLAGPAARIIEDLGFDVIDLNCGCPVDKVTKDGSGSGMLRHPELIGELIANMVAAVKIPVTVKIRTGWDSSGIIAPDVTEIAEQAGAKMIAIHGRTRAQGYSGLADRDIIRACKERANAIVVAGNGDIFDPRSALHMFDHTGCDAVLISRGTMGNPWLGADILDVLRNQTPPARSALQSLAVLLEHIDWIQSYRDSRRAALDIRRVGPWYCREIPGITELRKNLAQTQCANLAKEFVKSFAMQAAENSVFP